LGLEESLSDYGRTYGKESGRERALEINVGGRANAQTTKRMIGLGEAPDKGDSSVQTAQTFQGNVKR